MLNLISSLVAPVSGLLDKFIEDKDQRAMLAHEIATLAESDWTQVIDAPVDQAAWAAYRQSLRDIPSQAGFPNTVNWPVEP